MGIFQFGFQIFGIISTFGFNFEKNKDGADLSKDILDFKIQSSKSEKKNGKWLLFIAWKTMRGFSTT